MSNNVLTVQHSLFVRWKFSEKVTNYSSRLQILLSESFHSLHKANMHCATWKKKSMEHALFCKIK